MTSIQSILQHPIDEIRALINQKIFALDTTLFEVSSITEHQVGTSDGNPIVRLYAPKSLEACPLIVLIHGGAWVAGSIDTHDNLARYLSVKTNSWVASVSYTLAPDAKHQTILKQCYDALLWSVEYSTSHSNNQCFALVGDSAGGNIAAVLQQQLIQQQGPHMAALALINPALDLTCQGTLEHQNDEFDFLRWQVSQYIDSHECPSHPYISPLFAKCLSGFPPTFIGLTALDGPALADGQTFAQRLAEHHIDTTVFVQPDVGHLAGHVARATPTAMPTLTRVAEYLKAQFKANAQHALR